MGKEAKFVVWLTIEKRKTLKSLVAEKRAMSRQIVACHDLP